MLDTTNAAKTAYMAYWRAAHARNIGNEEMQQWDDLPEAARQAWEAAVLAVVDYLIFPGK